MSEREDDMAMTERGARRAETNAVAAYLEAIEHKPQRPREAIEKRRRLVAAALVNGSVGGIDRLRLVQRRNDLDAALAHHDRLIGLEATFVKVVGSWAARTGIGPAALLEVGVPADVLQRAGLSERQT